MSKRIAIVGGGLSGLVCASLLHKKHEITLFESKPYLGGHSYTHHIHEANKTINIDLGFVLFNKQAYPQFIKLLNQYNIPFQACDLSFSFHSNQLISYKGTELGNPFTPRRNLLSKTSYKLFLEIMRFNNAAKSFVEKPNQVILFGEFLKKHGLNELLSKAYLSPIMDVLWSCTKESLYHLPTYFVLNYLKDNGLLETFVNPKWYFIKSGAENYTGVMTEAYRDRIVLNTPIRKITRDKYNVTLHTDENEQVFDALILAVQADQALSMIANPSPLERHILDSFKYIHRNVFLHTDRSVMPPNKNDWGGLNYLDDTKPLMTYHANVVQKLDSKVDYFITMSEGKPINPHKILYKTTFSRPFFTLENTMLQKRHDEINGLLNTYYCGGYWGYGTLEDGVSGAIQACQPFL